MPVTDGQCVVVHVTASLFDETAILGEDVMVIRMKKGTFEGRVK